MVAPRLDTGPRYNDFFFVAPCEGRAFAYGVGQFSVRQFKILNAKRGGPTENAFGIDLVTNCLSVATEKIVGSYRNATLAM